jgi:hypothetical protein
LGGSPSGCDLARNPFEREPFQASPAHQNVRELQAASKRQALMRPIISQLDSIAWLLNLRGNDVPHLPVLLSQSILLSDGTQHLFIDPAKIPDGFAEHVGKSGLCA